MSETYNQTGTSSVFGLVARCNLPKSIMRGEIRFWPVFLLFDYILPESILASKIDFRRNKNFLLYVKITFTETTK